MSINVQVLWWIVFSFLLGGTYLEAIAESYGNAYVQLLRSCQTIFQNNRNFTKHFTFPPTNVHKFHFVHIISILFSLSFLLIGMLVGVKWCVIVILVFISLMVDNVEHLIMCRLAICIISSLEKCSNPLLVFNQVVFLLFTCKRFFFQYILGTSPLYMICKYFPSSGLSFLMVSFEE